jgi:hypothetical protein
MKKSLSSSSVSRNFSGIKKWVLQKWFLPPTKNVLKKWFLPPMKTAPFPETKKIPFSQSLWLLNANFVEC